MLSKINLGGGSSPHPYRRRALVNVGLVTGGAGYAPALYLMGLPTEIITAAVVVAAPLFIEAFRRNNRAEAVEDTSHSPDSPARGTSVPAPRKPAAQTDTPASTAGTSSGGDSGPAQ